MSKFDFKPVTHLLSVRATSMQSGSTLIMALISLVILLFASVGLIYSSDTSLVTAGNLAFKRDIVNQTERAVAVVKEQFVSGYFFNNAVALQQNVPSQNYSATILPSDKHGIPLVLMNDYQYSATYPSTSIITDTNSNVTLRYVIDRICLNPGLFDVNTCTSNSLIADKGGTNWITKVQGSGGAVYRITMRADGPRNTQAFVQSTFAN